MKMASNLQSCFTPGKETIKYWMKFSTSNCWQNAARLMANAGLMHCPYYHNMYSYTESPELHSPVYSSVCSRCVKQSIINFCSYLRRKTHQKCSRKFRIVSTVSIPSKWSMSANWRSHYQHLLLASGKLNYICCNTIYRNVRPLSLLCVLVRFSKHSLYYTAQMHHTTCTQQNGWSSYDGHWETGCWELILHNFIQLNSAIVNNCHE